jgi:GNAT superfamily N-acetyltransferase
MAPTDALPAELELAEMREADVPAGIALSTEAGWNQSAADWALLVRLGRAFGVPAPGGGLVATGVAFPYPAFFGWIGMVIVHGPYRQRGIATLLLERTIAELVDRGLVPFLDATPAGRPVYERMGFRPVEALSRWRGEGGGGPEVALPPVEDVSQVAPLDLQAFGADRSAILADLLARAGGRSWRDPAGEGFLLSRPGRLASYVGPLVARGTRTALSLLEPALAQLAGELVIDLPDREVELAALLTERGFRQERALTRMALERDESFGDAALVRAIAAPELG